MLSIKELGIKFNNCILARSSHWLWIEDYENFIIKNNMPIDEMTKLKPIYESLYCYTWVVR